jgi:hypothetical protein
VFRCVMLINFIILQLKLVNLKKSFVILDFSLIQQQVNVNKLKHAQQDIFIMLIQVNVNFNL